MNNIRRADLDGKKFVWACSDHFVTGKPAALFQKSHPDWAPTLCLGHSNVQEETSSHWERRKERLGKRTASQLKGLVQPTAVANQNSLGNTEPTTFVELKNFPDEVDSSTFTSSEIQTELSMGDIDNIEQKLAAIENENKNLKEKILSLIPIDFSRLERDKEMVLFLTGIPNYLSLMSLFSSLNQCQIHTGIV